MEIHSETRETSPQHGGKESYCPIFYCTSGVACKQNTVSLCLCPDQLGILDFFHILQSPMWLPCPTCHYNKLKDTAVTVDNGKANMFHRLKVMRSAYVRASRLFPLSIYNDVLVISFEGFKCLKGLLTQCGNKVLISK